jgi:hypothetical protein
MSLPRACGGESRYIFAPGENRAQSATFGPNIAFFQALPLLAPSRLNASVAFWHNTCPYALLLVEF